MLLPDQRDAARVLQAVYGAVAPLGLSGVQRELLEAIGDEIYGLAPAVFEDDPLTADAFLATGPTIELRQQVVNLLAVTELVDHPIRPASTAAAVEVARQLGVNPGLLVEARSIAERHYAVAYLDLQRSSWYAKHTLDGALHGRLWREIRSKLAYSGIVADGEISRKWHGLEDLPEGSWGRELAHFYHRHNFPFPGDKHGIYELGALHDFVHVLTGYDATAEGEIDTFAFIAAAMPDQSGLVLLAVTLGLFQNGSIRHVAGKRVRMARTDTLGDPGVIARMADALRRGRACNVDVMGGIDHFALAPLPLDEVRAQLGVSA